MTRPTRILPVPAIAAALVLAAASAGATEKPAPLSESVKASIEEALRDELRGEAIYARVLKDHGELRPFSNVVRAERRHAAFLEELRQRRIEHLVHLARPGSSVLSPFLRRHPVGAALPFRAGGLL